MRPSVFFVHGDACARRLQTWSASVGTAERWHGSPAIRLLGLFNNLICTACLVSHASHFVA